MSGSQAARSGGSEDPTDQSVLAPILDEVPLGTKSDPGFERLESRQKDMARDASRLSARLDGVEPRTSRLEELFKKLGSKTASLASLLNGLKQRTDSAHSRLDDLEPRSQQLEASAAEFEAQINTLRQQYSETEQRVDSLARAAGEMEHRLLETDARLVERIRAQEGRLDMLEPAHQALKADHSRLARRTIQLETLTDRLSELFNRAAWIGSASAVVLAIIAVGAYFHGPTDETSVALRLDERLTRLDSWAGKQALSQRANVESITHLGKDVTVLHQRLDSQDAAASELKQDYDTLAQKMGTVNSRLLTTDSRLSGELAMVKERLLDSDDLSGAPVDLASLHGHSWLNERNPDHYVIQLAATYRKRGIADFIARHRKVLPLEKLSVFQTVYKGRDWFVLLYGDYSQFDQALDAVASLPEALHQNAPYIRTFGGVQQRKLS